MQILPDWHYQVPFSRQALTDANTCTHSATRVEEIRRYLFHCHRLTPKPKRPAGSSTPAPKSTTTTTTTPAMQTPSPAGEPQTRAQHAARERAGARQTGARRLLQDQAGGPGYAGAQEAAGGGFVEEMQYPFVVSLEMPSTCGFEDMVAGWVAKGAYKRYVKPGEDARAGALRRTALMRPGNQAAKPRSCDAAIRVPDGDVSRAWGRAGGVEGSEWTCATQPLEYMVPALVMEALDVDGDGLISPGETCLSAREFLVVAGACNHVDEASKLACFINVSSTEGSQGTDDLADETISMAELEDYIFALWFKDMDEDGDDSVSKDEALATSPFIVAIQQQLHGIADLNINMTHRGFLAFSESGQVITTNLMGLKATVVIDLRDGLALPELRHLMLLMRRLYGEDLTLLEQHWRAMDDEFEVRGAGQWLRQKLDVVGLTEVVRVAGGCRLNDTDTLSNSTALLATGSGQGAGVGLVDGSGLHWQGIPQQNTLFVEGREKWVQYCAGTLIHPKWVLTAAGCVASKSATSIVNEHTVVLGGHLCVAGGGVSSGSACAKGERRARIGRVVKHPLYDVDARYDVALLELEQEELGFEPAPLDDGTDLGFLSCRSPNVTAVGWWPEDADTDSFASGAGDGSASGSGSPVPLRQETLDYVPLEDCRADHLAVRGYHELDPRLSICARARAGGAGGRRSGSSGTCWAKGAFGQDGGPLLLPRQGKQLPRSEGAKMSMVLVGVIGFKLGAGATPDTRERACVEEDAAVARAHVRLASMRQWILAVSALGAAAPRKLGIQLQALHLPPGNSSNVAVYAGATTGVCVCARALRVLGSGVWGSGYKL
jgi:hypothetical protein